MHNFFLYNKWKKYVHILCKNNKNFILDNIFTYNDIELNEKQFLNNANKNIILINGDCDFPPPLFSNTYEFDPKYNKNNNNDNNKSYEKKIDYRILQMIEKYNINIYCFSSSIYHKNIHTLPLGITWQYPIPNFIFFDNITKSILCYANFGIACDRWFGNPRRDCLNIINNKNFIQIENCIIDDDVRKKNNNYSSYFLKLKQSKFSICPRGCGIDCYRIYDSIISNCIPIVLKNNEFYMNFQDYPILFIDNYDMINENFLNIKWQEIDILNFDKKKLTFEYIIEKYNLKY